jgi:hypothetical protein
MGHMRELKSGTKPLRNMNVNTGIYNGADAPILYSFKSKRIIKMLGAPYLGYIS